MGNIVKWVFFVIKLYSQKKEKECGGMSFYFDFDSVIFKIFIDLLEREEERMGDRKEERDEGQREGEP